MREIELTKGYTARIDSKDFARLKGLSWCANICSGRPYAISGSAPRVWMHREIMGIQKGDPLVVDHINGDTLDNRRCNLRACSHRHNLLNGQSRASSKSQYRGVSKSGDFWEARVTRDGKTVFSRTVRSERVAAVLYNTHARECFGEFARLNRVLGETAIRRALAEEGEAKSLWLNAKSILDSL